MTNPPQVPQSSGYRPYFAPDPSTPPTGPEPRSGGRWFVVVVGVLAALVVTGVLLAVSGLTRFAPPAEDMIPIEGTTQVNFSETETYWVYVPEAEGAAVQCHVTFPDGTPAQGTTSSTTYTVQYRGNPYRTLQKLPPTKQDPSRSGVSYAVSCDTENAVAGPSPNTSALALGVAGVALAALCFCGGVAGVVVRAWLRVLRERRRLPAPTPRRW